MHALGLHGVLRWALVQERGGLRNIPEAGWRALLVRVRSVCRVQRRWMDGE